jgi:hypothetical protein
MQSAVLVHSEKHAVEKKQRDNVDLDYCFKELSFVALAIMTPAF